MNHNYLKFCSSLNINHKNIFKTPAMYLLTANTPPITANTITQYPDIEFDVLVIAIGSNSY